jgi:hypothetical protein
MELQSVSFSVASVVHNFHFDFEMMLKSTTQIWSFRIQPSSDHNSDGYIPIECIALTEKLCFARCSDELLATPYGSPVYQPIISGNLCFLTLSLETSIATPHS